jgi:Uma2 family endonuclease
MGLPAYKPKSFEDLAEALKFDERMELHGGTLEKKASPSSEHSDAQSGLVTLLRGRYGRSGGGNPGGWWIKSEASVFYPKTESLFHHDLAGWKRIRVPENPKGFPVRVAPDWVCEITLSTQHKDERVVPHSLAQHGVPWYWLMDLERGILTILKLDENVQKYLVHQKVFRSDGHAALSPFEDVELDLELVFGGDG